jgi:hypothetical protein
MQLDTWPESKGVARHPFVFTVGWYRWHGHTLLIGSGATLCPNSTFYVHYSSELRINNFCYSKIQISLYMQPAACRWS